MYSLYVLKTRDERTSTASHVLILVPHTVRSEFKKAQGTQERTAAKTRAHGMCFRVSAFSEVKVTEHTPDRQGKNHHFTREHESSWDTLITNWSSHSFNDTYSKRLCAVGRCS